MPSNWREKNFWSGRHLTAAPAEWWHLIEGMIFRSRQNCFLPNAICCFLTHFHRLYAVRIFCLLHSILINFDFLFMFGPSPFSVTKSQINRKFIWQPAKVGWLPFFFWTVNDHLYACSFHRNGGKCVNKEWGVSSAWPAYFQFNACDEYVWFPTKAHLRPRDYLLWSKNCVQFLCAISIGRWWWSRTAAFYGNMESNFEIQIYSYNFYNAIWLLAYISRGCEWSGGKRRMVKTLWWQCTAGEMM